MSAEIFDILMVVALGYLAGSGTGIITGYITHNQKNEWREMTSGEQTVNIYWSFSCVRYFVGGWDIIPWYNHNLYHFSIFFCITLLNKKKQKLEQKFHEEICWISKPKDYS